MKKRNLVRMLALLAALLLPGLAAADIQRRYPGPVARSPHKYVDGGEYLRVDAPRGDAVLVFETGVDGRVTGWRVGRPPAVDYVEGCS